MKKISKKTLNSSFWRWWYGNLTCFSQEHMQTFGYMWSMLPIIKELYDTHEEQCEKMTAYYPFFNTEPQIGAIVVGITAGLEEARANGAEGIDDEMINGIRAGLMGPLAGIGDSLIVGTYIPILLGIALGLAEGGSVLGPLFYIVVWNLFAYFGMRFMYFKGYELGGKAVDFLIGTQGEALRDAITTLGGIVIGAVSATWVSVTTSLELVNQATGEAYVVLQDQLDAVFPGLLNTIFIIFCWFLMSKKRMSPIKVMLLLVLIAFLGVVVGFFDPGLAY